MPIDTPALSRRAALAGTAALIAAPALAEKWRIGPPPHEKGPLVWMDMDQFELDAAFEQTYYAPIVKQIQARYASQSDAARRILGEPPKGGLRARQAQYSSHEKAERADVRVHPRRPLAGGEGIELRISGRTVRQCRAHYIALDFIQVKESGGDISVMADQVGRAIAWVYKNADQFGGDRNSLYVGGHSSGGHLCGATCATDWTCLGVPAHAIKGWHCMSGLFEMKPVRLSEPWHVRQVHGCDGRRDELAAPSRLCRCAEGRRQARRSDRGAELQPLRNVRVAR